MVRFKKEDEGREFIMFRIPLKAHKSFYNYLFKVYPLIELERIKISREEILIEIDSQFQPSDFCLLYGYGDMYKFIVKLDEPLQRLFCKDYFVKNSVVKY